MAKIFWLLGVNRLTVRCVRCGGVFAFGLQVRSPFLLQIRLKIEDIPPQRACHFLAPPGQLPRDPGSPYRRVPNRNPLSLPACAKKPQLRPRTPDKTLRFSPGCGPQLLPSSIAHQLEPSRPST